MPLPEHAPAARPMKEYTVTSWHCAVVDVVWVPGPCAPPIQRPAMLPAESANTRGELITCAVFGAASGTLMMSMRKYEIVVSVGVCDREHPLTSFGERAPDVPDTMT